MIKLDNLKAGVVDTNFYEPVYQKEYKAVSRSLWHFYFRLVGYINPEKGKVESGIKYVKNNFLLVVNLIGMKN